MAVWESKWTVLDDSSVRAGGQGKVVRVRRNSDGVLGALKELHLESQSVSERRARFAGEVIILKAIGGEGVPQVLDHNMDLVRDKSVPLYFVAEWVASEALSQYVSGQPQTVVEALEITKELARIVERCHKAGVGHRDIKPDNILHDSSTSHLFLVDFGTAWFASSEDDQDSFKTEWGQELGNRFLRIPDLAAGRDRRDFRIDLVFVVGVLFYLLTGRAPRVLADERVRPPHESLTSIIPASLVSSPNWSSIKRFFDVGFQPSIDHRFQSATEIIQRIDEILTPPASEDPRLDPQSEVAALRELLRTRVSRTIRRIEEALQHNSMMLVRYLNVQSDAAGLENERSAYPQVDTGRSIRVMTRVGQQYPIKVSARLEHLLTFSGAANTYVEAAYKIDSDPLTIYYHGHAADTDCVRDEMLKKAPELFALMVRHIREATEQQL